MHSQPKPSLTCRKDAFTLIELLVVVLIIGLLAAAALPQYEKAVWKARAAGMLTNVRALGDAQNVYFLANGQYATQYAQLDRSFDSLPDKHPSAGGGYLTAASSDAVRANEDYKLVINSVPNLFMASSAMFIRGPYMGGGVSVAHYVNNLSGMKSGMLYCYEHDAVLGKLCGPVYGAKKVGKANSITYYLMQ